MMVLFLSVNSTFWPSHFGFLKVIKKNIYSVTDYAPSYEAVHTIVHQATA